MRLRPQRYFLALAGCGSDDRRTTQRRRRQATAPSRHRDRDRRDGARGRVLDRGPAADAARAGAAGGGCRRPQARLDAAVACDYDTLEEIAVEQGEGFTFNYGGETDASEHWRDAEENPSGRAEADARAGGDPDDAVHPQRGGSYAWPTAYSEEPDRGGLAGAGRRGALLAGAGRLDAEQHGSYLGYRTAITADGDWQFFVAGD